MKLNAPKKSTWYIALILGLLGIIASFISIPFVSQFNVWFVVIGWALIMIATYLKDL